MILRVRPFLFALLTWCALSAPASAQSVSVGSGATPQVTSSFIAAYDRKCEFAARVTVPIGPVKALGSPGLVQEVFRGKRSRRGTLALIDPDPNGVNYTYQMFVDLYGYYKTAGVSNSGSLTFGYPTDDTTACPA